MNTQLTWYGQSAFKVVTPGGKVLLIDPWLTNPVFERGKEEIAALKDVDLILVTHGHSDHVGDAVEIGKRTRAKLVATFDLSQRLLARSAIRVSWPMLKPPGTWVARSLCLEAKSESRLCPRGMAPEFPGRKPRRRFMAAIPPDW